MTKSLTAALAASHIARANRAARVSPEAFARAVFLAQASARVRTERFWPYLTQIYTQFLNGRRHPVINGKTRVEFFSLNAKWEGIVYNYANRADLHSAVTGAKTDAEALAVLMDGAKWLSTVKGGFVIQLVRGAFGCIDSINRRIYNLPKNITGNVDKYAELCESLGGSAMLWANWCNVAALERGADPIALSLAHVEFIETGMCAPLAFGK